MGTLAGKVALVTGGSSGIGLASAEELIREGAFVYITGRKKAELDAAANRLGERWGGIQADIPRWKTSIGSIRRSRVMGKRWTCSLPMLAVARLHRLEVSLKSNMTRHSQPM